MNRRECIVSAIAGLLGVQLSKPAAVGNIICDDTTIIVRTPTNEFTLERGKDFEIETGRLVLFADDC